MKNKIAGQLTLLIMTLLLTACDRVANIQVQVINSFSKTISVTFIDNNHFTDTLQTVVVKSGDTAVILKTHSGILGRYEIPHDVFLSSDTFEMFKKFQISIDSIVLKKDFRLSKEWTYIGVDKDLGVYKLKIDSTDN